VKEELPKAPAVRAALRMTTDRLAAELARPESDAPDWSDFEWRTAIAVAVMHGISGLLANRLRWQGPPAWQAFLAEQAEQGRRREQRIRALLAELDRRAHEAALPMLALKGSALLRLDLYAAGERPMSDVDLLVRPDAMEAAERLVLAAGYERSIAQPRHIVYEPLGQSADIAFGEHAGNPVKIELHAAIREPLPVHEVDITADLLHADAPGLNTYPSLAALMRHLLLHTAGNLCNYGVRLIQLHDIAMLAPRLRAADWDEALASAWWAGPPLQLAQRLFPGCLSIEAQAALQRSVAVCPRWLRGKSASYRLVDVSLSRLGIPMLPGIEWSHSVGEAAALVRRRLHPGRVAQASNDLAVSRQHALAGAAWSHRPRWLKALSFLLGTPPRVQTMYSLHRALDYRPSSSA